MVKAAAALTQPTPEQWRSWGIDPAWSRFIDVAGHAGTHRWHVLDRNPATAGAQSSSATLGTIVCVHGNPTWSFLWRSVLQQLGDRYRVIAVDQLGMGFSQRTGLRRYADRVRDLNDVINALEISGPIIIAGHDWGGAVSMGWAVENPGRLRAMVLCNTGIAVPAGRKAPALIRLAAAGPITSLVGHRTRAFVDGTLGLSWSRLPPATREGLRAPYRKAANRRAIAQFVADVPFSATHPSAAAITAVASRLHEVTAPVLLAWGAADPVFDDSFALDLAQRMSHADRHRYPGIGHLALEETNVAGTIDAWLHDRLEGAASTLRQERTEVHVPADLLSCEPAWSALVRRSTDTATAFVDGATGVRTSFADLHKRVMGIARGVAELGLRPGDRVALLVPPGLDLLSAVYGVWRAGGVTVIADRGLGLKGLGRAVKGAHVQWVIGPPKALAAARVLRWAPRARLITVGPRCFPGDVAMLDDVAGSAAELPPSPAPDDDAAVLYTSGATGPAKGVRYRHGQLAAQRDALLRTYDITANDRLVAAFAPFALYGPAMGIASTIPEGDVTKPGALTAVALAQACGRVDATIVFASPAALANVVRTATVSDPPFTNVRLVLSAGAPVPVATLRSAAVLFPSAELHTPYGMTEGLPVADISLAEIAAAGVGAGVCVGPAVGGAEVLIAALDFDAGQPVQAVPTGVSGEILIRAPWVSDGYDQLWKTQYDARPRDVAGVAWHRTGDVGHRDGTDRLWVEGRSVHVIYADTGPITPVPVEVAVEGLEGIERCAAVGVGPRGCQQLVVVVEQAERAEGLADEGLARRIRAALTDPVAAVLSVQRLPVDIRHNTKIDRVLVGVWAATVLSGATAKRSW